VQLSSFSATEVDLLGIFGFQKRIPVVVNEKFKVFPVIQSGSLYIAIGDYETHRSDNMKVCVEPYTESSDGTRVLWYLRIYENNVNVCF